VAALTASSGGALGSPLSQTREQAAQTRAQIEALDAKLAKSVSDYDAAQARVAKLERATAANSAELDTLLARLGKLQDRLNARADDMYRSGPYAFVEVLAGTTSFDQFVSTWDLLTELSREDARMIDGVRKARLAAVATANTLQAQQSAAASQLRAVETARASAAADLAKRKALLATYQGRISALQAEQAARAAAIAKAASNPAPSGGHKSSGTASSGSSSSGGSGTAYAGRTGSGAWQTGSMSWYGPGFYGNHMANGEVLRPDSMVVAHMTLPFGTLVEFRFHGRTAVATVKDRGPFYPGREFDLGPGIARVLGFEGVHDVDYRIIGR
jgi:peptidoglycan DL-endopeptidase CwlO